MFLKKTALGAAVALLGLLLSPRVGNAQPPGFQLYTSGTGVQVYKKEIRNGEPDYVTVIDLRSATLLNLHGTVVATPTANSKVSRKRIPSFWDDAVRLNTTTSKVMVVVNGTFFNDQINPTTLSFGLKANGRVISNGDDLNALGARVLNKTFTFNNRLKRASIQAYDRQSFDGTTPDVVGALDVTAPLDSRAYRPRTFVGIADTNRDGDYETVYIYASAYALPTEADSALRQWGATTRAMLDGGGSTAMRVLRRNGRSETVEDVISSTRTVPHALAVFAGR